MAHALAGCGIIPVGAAAAFDPTLAGAVEPLVALAPAVWRQGLATEALAAIAAYAFDERGLPRLVAVVDAPNAASHRLMLRAGFHMTGESDGPRYRLRSYERMKHV